MTESSLTQWFLSRNVPIIRYMGLIGLIFSYVLILPGWADSGIVYPNNLATLNAVGAPSAKQAILGDILYFGHTVGKSSTDGARVIGIDHNGTVVYSFALKPPPGTRIKSQTIHAVQAFNGSVYFGTSPDGAIWKFTPPSDPLNFTSSDLKLLSYGLGGLGPTRSCQSAVQDEFIWDFAVSHGELYAGAYPCADVFLVDDGGRETVELLGSTYTDAEQKNVLGQSYAVLMFGDSKAVYARDIFGYIRAGVATSKSSLVEKMVWTKLRFCAQSQYCDPSTQLSLNWQFLDPGYIWQANGHVYVSSWGYEHNSDGSLKVDNGGNNIPLHAFFQLDGAKSPLTPMDHGVSPAPLPALSFSDGAAFSAIQLTSDFNDPKSPGLGMLDSNRVKEAILELCVPKESGKSFTQAGALPNNCKASGGQLESHTYSPKPVSAAISEPLSGVQNIFRIGASLSGAIWVSGAIPGNFLKLVSSADPKKVEFFNYGAVAEGEAYSILAADSSTMLLGLYSGPARIVVLDLNLGTLRALILDENGKNPDDANELGWRPQSGVMVGSDSAVFGGMPSYLKTNDGGKMVVLKKTPGPSPSPSSSWQRSYDLTPFKATQQSVGSLVSDGKMLYAVSDNERNTTIGPVPASTSTQLIALDPSTPNPNITRNVFKDHPKYGRANAGADLVMLNDPLSGQNIVYGIARFWRDWNQNGESSQFVDGPEALFKWNPGNAQIDYVTDLPCHTNFRTVYNSMAVNQQTHLVGLCDNGFYDYDIVTGKAAYYQFANSDQSSITATSGFSLINGVIFFGSYEKLYAIQVAQ